MAFHNNKPESSNDSETEIEASSQRLKSENSNTIKLVQSSYDVIAARYLEWRLHSCVTSAPYLQDLVARLPQGAKILDLGCGAGTPFTKILAEHANGFRVTGVDISEVQIGLARGQFPSTAYPQVEFIRSDMMALDFPPRVEKFDAITAFYSVIHLPREDQKVMMGKIWDWLKPGGSLLVNLAVEETEGDIEEDWLGSGRGMFWAAWGIEGNKEMVQKAGFHLLEAEVFEHDESGVKVPFQWILGRRGNE